MGSLDCCTETQPNTIQRKQHVHNLENNTWNMKMLFWEDWENVLQMLHINSIYYKHNLVFISIIQTYIST